MSEPFIGEIRIFAGSFAPRGWAFCDGTLLPIAQHTALFSILGTAYGGDGKTTLALPDLRGRVPLHQGEGPGLPRKSLGQSGGSESVTLTVDQIPPHRHDARAVDLPATEKDPSNQMLARPEENTYGKRGQPSAMGGSLAAQGGGQPYNHRQPYLVLNFIIALVGLFPSRS